MLQLAVAALVIGLGTFVLPAAVRDAYATGTADECSVTCSRGSCSAKGQCTCTCSVWLDIATCSCTGAGTAPEQT
ncbi:MAG TPA: hypothetical protein VF142_15560 [Longimicrobium sp.]